MKVVIAGKSFIACKALTHLKDLLLLGNLGFELIAIPVVGDNGEQEWQPSLIKTAKECGVCVINRISSLNLSEGDVFISLEYDRLVNPSALNGASCFNIHFSNLPKYRGCLTSIWPIRERQILGGVTLHLLTHQIDQGPIVDQLLFELPVFFTSYDLYLYYNAFAFELFKRNILSILCGQIKLLDQDDKAATYYKRSLIDFGDTEITDFNKACIQVRDYIRSLIFKPYQYPTFKGRPIRLCDDVMYPKRMEHFVGQVVVENESHAVVCCKDGYIRLEFTDDFCPLSKR